MIKFKDDDNIFFDFLNELVTEKNINNLGELISYFKDEKLNNNLFDFRRYINCYLFDNIIIFYTKTNRIFDISKTNNIQIKNYFILNKILNEFQLCLFDKFTLNLLFFKKKEINFIDDINNFKFDKFSIRDDHDYEEIYLLNIKNKLLIIDKTEIINITNTQKILNNKKYKILINNIDYSKIKINNIYKYLIRFNSIFFDDNIKFVKEFNINSNKNKNKNIKFEKDLLKISKLLKDDENNIKIKREKIKKIGYIIKLYISENDYLKIKFNFKLVKKIKNICNNKNQQINYLKLYQFNLLNKYLPFISYHYKELKMRIKNSILNISKEILNIYHLTRKDKNKEIYLILKNSYKKILNELHKIYKLKKNKEIIDSDDIYLTNSLNLFDVIKYLKEINTINLSKLFSDRLEIQNDLINLNNKIINECIYCKLQNELIKKSN